MRLGRRWHQFKCLSTVQDLLDDDDVPEDGGDAGPVAGVDDGDDFSEDFPDDLSEDLSGDFSAGFELLVSDDFLPDSEVVEAALRASLR